MAHRFDHQSGEHGSSGRKFTARFKGFSFQASLILLFQTYAQSVLNSKHRLWIVLFYLKTHVLKAGTSISKKTTPAARLFSCKPDLRAAMHIKMQIYVERGTEREIVVSRYTIPYCYWGGQLYPLASVSISMHSYASIAHPYAPISLHTTPLRFHYGSMILSERSI